MDELRGLLIDELLSTPVGQKLSQAMNVLETVQRNLAALSSSEDSDRLNLLKIGTVFQIFLIDTLASGKRPGELSKDDWIGIANNISKYAVMEDGQRYSEFVFLLYADYIDVSASRLEKIASKDSIKAIQELAETIRQNTVLLNSGQLTEANYIEACLWLSLEGMIKLLSATLVPGIGPEFRQLLHAAAQLGFEYGRYVLFSREQAILTEYVQNQYVLDEKLKQEYDAYLVDLRENADRFQHLIDEAFSPALHDSLLQSVALARAAGVNENEILTTTRQIDDYFMN